MIGNMATVGWWIPDAVVPAVGDVEAGVQYGASGTDFTGTFVVPAEADVEVGVEYGESAEFTGTLDPGATPDYPDVADVRAGTDYDDGGLTGTCNVPAAADVEYGVDVDDTTGTFVVPAVGDVEAGVTFGAAAEFTGTFVVPAEGVVKTGETYGASAEFTGTYGSATSTDTYAASADALMEERGTSAVYTRKSLDDDVVASGFPVTILALWSYGRNAHNYRTQKQYSDGRGDAISAIVSIYSDSTNGVDSVLPEKDTITDAAGDEWTVKSVIAHTNGLWRLRVARYLHQRSGRAGAVIDR